MIKKMVALSVAVAGMAIAANQADAQSFGVSFSYGRPSCGYAYYPAYTYSSFYRPYSIGYSAYYSAYQPYYGSYWNDYRYHSAYPTYLHLHFGGHGHDHRHHHNHHCH